MSEPPVLLMTRPAEASKRFVAAVRDAGVAFDPIVSPLLEIVFAGALPDLPQTASLAFTSANGVAAYAALGGPARLAYCVGDATAAAARAQGLDAVSAGRDVATLAPFIVARHPGGPIWHLHGTHSRGALAQRLRVAGIDAHETVVYDQVLRPLSSQARAALEGRRPVVAPLFSPRTALHFAAQKTGAAPLYVAALSPAVAEAVDAPYLRGINVAEAPNATGMRKVVVQVLKNLAQVEAHRDAQ